MRDEASAPLNRLPVRVLLCSPELPPLHTGHAAVLERMFRGIHPDDYCLASFVSRPVQEQIAGRSLPATAHEFRPGWPVNIADDYPLRGVRQLRVIASDVLRRARILAALVRSEGCGAIVVTSSNTPDPIAALLAARLAHVPLIVYMLDNWRHLLATAGRLPGELASLIQPHVLAGARLVMVPNSAVADDLWHDHRRASVVVGIPLPDPDLLRERPTLSWPREEAEIRIVFTGQIYDAHHDGVRLLLAALESGSMEHVSLHVYTSQGEDYLRSKGLIGRMVLHPHVPPPGINEVQREADILFLPLGFETPYPDIVRTASPTKTGEYLASGRPILVHAPPDSYLATSARRFNFAAVVDRPSSAELVAAIQRIASDPAFRSEITTNARHAVEALHGPAATTELFIESLRRALGDAGRRLA